MDWLTINMEYVNDKLKKNPWTCVDGHHEPVPAKTANPLDAIKNIKTDTKQNCMANSIKSTTTYVKDGEPDLARPPTSNIANFRGHWMR